MLFLGIGVGIYAYFRVYAYFLTGFDVCFPASEILVAIVFKCENVLF